MTSTDLKTQWPHVGVRFKYCVELETQQMGMLWQKMSIQQVLHEQNFSVIGRNRQSDRVSELTVITDGFRSLVRAQQIQTVRVYHLQLAVWMSVLLQFDYKEYLLIYFYMYSSVFAQQRHTVAYSVQKRRSMM